MGTCFSRPRPAYTRTTKVVPFVAFEQEDLEAPRRSFAHDLANKCREKVRQFKHAASQTHAYGLVFEKVLKIYSIVFAQWNVS